MYNFDIEKLSQIESGLFQSSRRLHERKHRCQQA